MTNARGVRTALLLVALAVVPIGVASADVLKIPSVVNSTIPTHIVLVGHAGTTPDRAVGEAIVQPRDLANQPLFGTTITFDFGGCTGVRLSTESLDPAVVPMCASRSWSTLSDLQGVARLTVLGGSTGAAAPAVSRVHIYADGVLLGTLPVATYDLDGNGGVNSADLALWMDDYGSGTPMDRSDYDGNGLVDSSDLASWLTAYSLGGSAESASAYCP